MNSALPCVERAERRGEAEHLGERHLGLDAGEAVRPPVEPMIDAAALHEHAEDAALRTRPAPRPTTFMIGSRICGLARG